MTSFKYGPGDCFKKNNFYEKWNKYNHTKVIMIYECIDNYYRATTDEGYMIPITQEEIDIYFEIVYKT